MKNIIQLTILLALSLLLHGCDTPPKNQIPLVKGLRIQPTNTNDTKLVIFNKYSSLAGIDGSAINVKLNGKGIAQVGQGRYTQVIVPKGKYQLDLKHWDLVNWSSQHQVEFVDSESFLLISATPISNTANLISTLPPDFEQKFKPIE